jgi:hypothetical protein
MIGGSLDDQLLTLGAAGSGGETNLSFGEDLLAEDVGVAAVLGELPQHDLVDAPDALLAVTSDDIVEAQLGCGLA